MSKTTALIIVDVQNDFCPGGSLAVPQGDRIIPVINDITSYFDLVVLTQDWHPADHLSFASNHRDKAAFSTIEMPYGEQILWPDHCIQATPGAEFHPALNHNAAHVVIKKGFRKEIDSYSGFQDNDRRTVTGLEGLLKALDVQQVFVCGLATDFCVKWTCLDAAGLGFSCYMIKDAARGIDIESSVDKAYIEMQQAGIRIIGTSELKSLVFQ